jgi:hypothetical protein
MVGVGGKDLSCRLVKRCYLRGEAQARFGSPKDNGVGRKQGLQRTRSTRTWINEGLSMGSSGRHREGSRDLPGFAPSLSKVRRLKLKLVRDRLTRVNHRPSAVIVGPGLMKSVGNKVWG